MQRHAAFDPKGSWANAWSLPARLGGLIVIYLGWTSSSA
jgi:hypothetical protein